MTLPPLRPLRPVDDGHPYLAISGTVADVVDALAGFNIAARETRHRVGLATWNARCPACRRPGALIFVVGAIGVALHCRARCPHSDVLAALQAAQTPDDGRRRVA